MGRTDREQERQRLAALYSGMTEEELANVAADSSQLTDEAVQALHEEVNRRGLDLSIPASQPANDEVEFRKLVSVRTFRDLPEAILAKGMLDSAGIESFLVDDNIVRTDWFYSNAVGGIKLQVKPEDAAAAIEVLEQPIPEGFEVDGIGDYQQPRCPKCQSLEITFQGLNKPVAYSSARLGGPIPLQEELWKCHSCGAEWGETDAPEKR